MWMREYWVGVVQLRKLPGQSFDFPHLPYLAPHLIKVKNTCCQQVSVIGLIATGNDVKMNAFAVAATFVVCLPLHVLMLPI